MVEYVPRGATDDEVANIARNREMTLITRDYDFANEFLYPPESYSGIVVLRIHPPKPENLVKALNLLLKTERKLKGGTFIVYEGGFTTIR